MYGDDSNSNGNSKKKLESKEIPENRQTGGLQLMEGSYEIRQVNALLRFHFKLDPDKLNDDEWAEAWADLKYALKCEAKRLTQNTTI